MTCGWKCFTPRSVVPAGPRAIAGWRLKSYEINAAPAGVDWADLAPGLTLAGAALPQPPVAAGRAGAGIVIAHLGASHVYLVLAWWDNENELFVRTFVRPRAGGAWIPGGDEYSFCVWDLDVLWFERSAWVECMLGTGGADVDQYFARRFVRSTDSSPE